MHLLAVTMLFIDTHTKNVITNLKFELRVKELEVLGFDTLLILTH